MILQEVESDGDYEVAIKLFEEYASQIGVDLSFQNFNDEIRDIKNQYSRPDGLIFLVFNDQNDPVGCFGIRKFEEGIGELKRMYLKDEARGQGLGKRMLKDAVKAGKALGYLKMRLDTLPSMNAAIGLYKSLGFYEIDAYRYNPISGTKYFEISLK